MHERVKEKLNLPQAAFTCLELTMETTRARYEISPKSTIKTRQWRRSGVFIVDFGHISHLVLAFLFLTLNMFKICVYLYLCMSFLPSLTKLHHGMIKLQCVDYSDFCTISMHSFDTVLRLYTEISNI